MSHARRTPQEPARCGLCLRLAQEATLLQHGWSPTPQPSRRTSISNESAPRAAVEAAAAEERSTPLRTMAVAADVTAAVATVLTRDNQRWQSPGWPAAWPLPDRRKRSGRLALWRVARRWWPQLRSPEPRFALLARRWRPSWRTAILMPLRLCCQGRSCRCPRCLLELVIEFDT